MPKLPMSGTLSGLEAETDARTKVSSEEFSAIIRSHLRPIIEAEESIRVRYTPFTLDSIVQPLECRKAIESLERLNIDIQAVYELLSETVQPPFILVAIGYKLVFILQVLEEQSRKLISLIEGYRAICMAPSGQAERHRQHICDSFEKLLQHLADIPQQTIFLEDEIRFQERRFPLSRKKS